MFVLTVQFGIKPEHADAFGEIVIRQAINSKQLEPEFESMNRRRTLRIFRRKLPT